ncbi:AFR636Cp [Eremothecium gossypii ATCC 10895]|uniref:AFR636Cp n=1 Tax=Eremothecium gossypii (strain ATCC 10895 / CBS 109.51 / FGSC 9923 / NRRL Y-1056) TaxID=284811 RepID=Q752E0_EREGS|nr:AFR636Cp [Eremothecium gossypii ATCC 10895]AAS54007.2 AFR636Cp [Eremothecium gossypii ATCC 10895]
MTGHEDFVATLESLKELKSGISGSRIKKLTTYALENVNAEEYLIDKIINYSRTCPATHKLGSLYVIDSIGRAFLNKCKDLNQSMKSSAQAGTYGHALFTLGENIQTLLSDGVEKSSAENRDKIKDLVDIWDKADLFQKGVLNAVRGVWFALKDTGKSSSSQASDPKERAIQILSNLKPMESIPASISVPADLGSNELALQQAALMQLLASLQSQLAEPAGVPSTKSRAAQEHRTQQTQRQPLEPQRHQYQQQQHQRHEPTQYIGRSARSNKRSDGHTERSRSKSPKRHEKKGNQSSNNANNNTHNNNNNTSGNSSTNNNHHLYPEERNVPTNPHFRPRHVSFDPSMPADHIKVYSRTLFVGGVPNTMKEHDIAKILGKFGEVQSVILNNSRKHAFVKIYSRQEADSILLNFNKDESSPLRIRWAVGFGPRDCCDYQHGSSIIPMHRLTEVDRKWSLCAEWGGTGGQPLQSGMVFEEPDIIVGEGVSSKAISQKMPTDRGNGPKSGKLLPGNTFRPAQTPTYEAPIFAQPPPPAAGYPQMYQGIPQQIPQHGIYPQQTIMPVMAPQHQPQDHHQQQSPAFDPTAQLNSLMSMLNKQQQ